MTGEAEPDRVDGCCGDSATAGEVKSTGDSLLRVYSIVSVPKRAFISSE